MKKNILIGLFVPLFYYFVFNVMIYTDYNEKYDWLQNAFIQIAPALPGVSLIFLLIRDSLKEFFKSLGICFTTSFLVDFVCHRISLMIYTKITGYTDFCSGEELIFGITTVTYLASCLIGSVIACVITCIRQRKHNRNKTVAPPLKSC